MMVFLVGTWWREANVSGYKGYCLLQKLKYIKKKLKGWDSNRREQEKVEEQRWWDELQNLHRLEDEEIK